MLEQVAQMPTAKNKLYVIMGVSGAGKDTCANIITKYMPLEIHKFAAAPKRIFEQIYEIPYGTMDDRASRLESIEGTNETYLDRFIEWHKYQSIIFPPGWVAKKWLESLKCSYNLYMNYAVTDLRSMAEVGAISNLFSHFDIILVYVGGRGEKLKSDKDCVLLTPFLKDYACKRVIIRNDGDMLTLEKTLVDKLNLEPRLE